MRSFSNLWFWIALAVFWSTASHWVLGLPWDLVLRAHRKGGQPQVDVNDLARINTNRILMISQISGLWLMMFASFSLTSLAVLGFVYKVELAQAIFLLSLPMSVVGLLSVKAAKQINAAALEGEELYHRLAKHRFWVQFIGMFSIFVTSLWGMYQNFLYSPLG